MVLGAGRGPLVTASMNAARRANVKIRVFAVEKNPNAVVTYVLMADYTAESACFTLCRKKYVYSLGIILH